MMIMETIGELIELNSGDPRVRMELGQKILDAFSEQSLPSDSTVLTQFVDMMVQWLNGSNFKVALLALEILDVSLGVSGDLMAPYLLENSTALMERLGDHKEQVREQALLLLLKFMSVPHSSPQLVFERLMSGFTHKQWLVRLGVCQILVKVLRTFGAGSVQLSKMTPLVCKLVSDPNSQVRDTAYDTLVEMYMFTGDRLAYDIQKRRLLPEAKNPYVFSRFEDVKRQGLVSQNGEPLEENTLPDSSLLAFKTPSKPSVSATPTTSAGRGRVPRTDLKGPELGMMSAGAKSRSTSVPANKARLGQGTGIRQSSTTGGVSEETFEAAFEEGCPRVQFFSGRDLTAIMENCNEILADTNNDWDKRVDALKKLRSVVICGAVEHAEFFSGLRQLEVAFQLSVKDLRSQVVREACITIAYFSEKLSLKMEHFAETVFHVLVGLIPNSAKVMASSGLVTCRFILRNVCSPKLIPVVTSNMESKSREIRRACCEFIFLMLSNWQSHTFERNVQAVQEAIRQGLNDADLEARTYSRKSFHAFGDHFPELGKLLYDSLEPRTQKQLNGDMSQTSSNGSIAGFKRSQENVNRFGAYYQRGAYSAGGRSNSAIDSGAARRALQKHTAASSGYGRAKPPAYPVNSLPRSKLSPVAPSPATTDYRTGRSQNRPSMSQPGSRSGSPTSRLPSGVVRKTRPSQGGSREHSPNRFSGPRRFSTDTASPVASSKYLAHSRDMERAVFDALSRRMSGKGEDQDVSDASSVCSERSLSRFESAELTEALRCCSLTNWAERREGLVTLQNYFKAGRAFNHAELKKICETFTRMFVDPHNKTFSLFLDTLVEFLSRYRSEVCDWLYVLLTRLLTKLGGDMLASIQSKLHRTLDVVRESFPYELQYQTLLRYIMDPVQTPSLKVKEALLNYMVDLIHMMDAGSFVNTSDTRQAVSKIVHWTMEPKSPEVRRASSNVITALFSLNSSEFSAMVQTFPKSYQDIVFRLLNQLMAKDNRDRWNSPPGRSSMSPQLNGNDERVDLENVRDKLRETSAQIQDCFAGGAGVENRGKGSQDSGIVDAVSDTVFPKVSSPDLYSDEDRQEELICCILTEMSNHNRRVQERLKVMGTLKHMTRDGSFTLWQPHFKSILFIMLETTGDKDPEIRKSALNLLKELCLCQAARFRDYAELTLLKILEAFKDKERDVAKAAEDCSLVLASHLPPHLCVRMLNPVIKNESPPTLQAAIKILTKVMEQLSPDEVEAILPDVMPGITEQFNNSNSSSVRKDSVLTLVAIHNAVGREKMDPYLQNFSNSKIKLLNIYISKQQSR